MKCTKSFSDHIKNLAKLQGLLPKPENEADCNDDPYFLDTNVVIQLFSPLITSQRIMMNHFSNPYSSIKCYNGLNIVLDKYAGYLFICMDSSHSFLLKRLLGVLVAVSKHVCGPDLLTLKTNLRNRKIMDNVVDTWYRRVLTDQSILIEAVEQMRVTTQVSAKCLKALSEAADKMKSSIANSQIHTLIMANGKFLSLYSTRNASELMSSDILFLSLVSDVMDRCVCDNEHLPLVTVYPDDEINRLDVTNGNQTSKSYDFVFLLGRQQRPHAVHVYRIMPNVALFLIYELGNDQLNVCLLEALETLCKLQEVQIRDKDKGIMRSSVETADNSIKRLNESLKKKSIISGIDKLHISTLKATLKKWELVRKKYEEYVKNRNADSLQKVDSTVDSIIASLRSTYSNCVLNISAVNANHNAVLPIFLNVQNSLQEFAEIFKTSSNNFVLGTKSTFGINKYLEEFPGLVHFIYVDRLNHRFVAPTLDFSSSETNSLTKKKIWLMVEFAWSHLKEGYTNVMWKDTIFNYSYFLWFEDVSGTPLKPKNSPSSVVKSFPIPGIINEDFFHYLMKQCFPLQSSQRVRCYELFLIHLGLVTSSCALEQSRRLTATIWEIAGVPANPLDLL